MFMWSFGPPDKLACADWLQVLADEEGGEASVEAWKQKAWSRALGS